MSEDSMEAKAKPPNAKNGHGPLNGEDQVGDIKHPDLQKSRNKQSLSPKYMDMEGKQKSGLAIVVDKPEKKFSYIDERKDGAKQSNKLGCDYQDSEITHAQIPNNKKSEQFGESQEASTNPLKHENHALVNNHEIGHSVDDMQAIKPPPLTQHVDDKNADDQDSQNLDRTGENNHAVHSFNIEIQTVQNTDEIKQTDVPIIKYPDLQVLPIVKQEISNNQQTHKIKSKKKKSNRKQSSNKQEIKRPIIDTEKVLGNALNSFVTLMINNVISNEFPKVNYLYPDWPNGAKSKMLYKPPKEREELKKQKDAKSARKTKIQKVEKPATKKGSLEVSEVCKLTKRNSRYKGRILL